MEKRFKVVRVGRRIVDCAAPVVEEAEELAKVNAELVESDCTTEDEIIEVAKDADAIIRSGVWITRRVIEALPKCRAIINPSVGFDKIDVEAATNNGIVVVNNPSPEWCVEEVSNHAVVLLLACAKKLTLMNDMVKRGNWAGTRRTLAPMVSIYGQTLGLVGCGNLGRMTARKAQCFGLKILGHDPYVDKSLVKEYGITLVSLSELLRESDFVSVHTLLNEETRHLIGEKEFRQMKPTAYYVNTARGPVTNEAALIRALQEKWIAGAGLDVFEKEPVDLDNPLLKMDNVVVTPHSGAYSDAALRRRGICAGQEAARVLSGCWPKNVVNKEVKPRVDLIKEG